MGDVFTSTVSALNYRCKSARQVWDVRDAQGWAAQTRTTSSTVLMDLWARFLERSEDASLRKANEPWFWHG